MDIRKGEVKVNEDQVFENYYKLANKVAYKYKGIADIEDLKQVAYEALIMAYRNFDSSKGFEFSTYAYKIIWSKVFKYLAKDRPLPISNSHHELVFRIKRMETKYLDLEQLSVALSTDKKKVTVKRVKAALKDAKTDVIKLDKEMIDEDSGTILDTVTAEEVDSVLNLDIDNYLNNLNERELRVYGFRVQGYSQDEIADLLNVSQMTISRTLKKMQNKYNKYFNKKY